ncbi:pantoate--beta-alanine ligase [Amnibacterium sp. CER49]|uniref:pantoate--beta-alanine ligase n=1 Tax=Amnibacterium sp. CER49 TaxID=3039161 RepID=UPI00244D4554|nr:pantoate--beta-alanine ligase [Amnibacterium sp. CER49]MDH2443788.1 pantoate--beta-alanine ligase [Amnibacterium sp. CER49]
MSIEVVYEIPATRAAVRALRDRGRVALVPTMGALHDGHLALVAAAHESADAVVASVFVNPLQFGPNEDFQRYPRTFEADRAALEAAEVDLVFAPGVDDMYPDGPVTVRVAAGPVGELLEGAVRPGHFDGVLTVVAKLISIVQPDVVLFGQKDAQQVFLVQRMVRDLDLPVEVRVVPIQREGDGLARSSRNRYLSGEERAAARAMPDALAAAAQAAPQGAQAAADAARAVLSAVAGVAVDYVAIVDPATFDAVDDRYRGPALVLLAARFGGTRLLDNAAVVLREAPQPERP